MATSQVKSITLRAGYESDLRERLTQDVGAIKSFKRNLEKNPIRIPVRLDLRSVRSEAVKAAAELRKQITRELASVKLPTGASVSKGGIIIPAGAGGAMKDFAATSKGAFKEIRTESGKLLQSYEQLARGVQRVTTATKKGKNVKLVDTRPLEDFQRALADIERKFAGRLGTAKGNKGDVAGILAEKSAAIQSVLRDPKLTEAVKNTPTFQRADRSLDRLEERINSSAGSQQARTARETQAKRANDLRNALENIDRAAAGKIGSAKGNKGDVARALEDKRIAIAGELSKFQDLLGSPAYRSALKTIGSLDEQIARTRPQQQRAADKTARDSTIGNLRDKLDTIDRTFAGQIGRSKGNKGDVAAVLKSKRDAIQNELAGFTTIADSPEFRQAQRKMASLTQQIEQALPKQDRQTASERRQNFNARAARIIDRTDDALNRRILKQNKGDEAAAQSITNRAVREREVNRVLDERERLLDRQVKRYQQLADIAKRSGFSQAESRFLNAAGRVGGQLEQTRLDRRRSAGQESLQGSELALKRQLDYLSSSERIQRQIIANAESQARKLRDQASREAELLRLAQARKNLSESARTEAGRIAGAARSAGFTGLEDRATNKAAAYHKQAIGDLRALEAATNRSGHAFNFHTSSLLKNAATFTRWYVPAQAAMGAFSALNSGIRQAVEAERTFKILNAVFRGSREDARQLAEETLALAAANGRSTDEAAEAAVAWSRMGLTRTQTLVAIESSLRAANVAEISAAEATNYLTAAYKAYHQTIAEIPATLDYINALSNKNAVAPKEIFQGLSRSAAVAKDAGIELTELAAIITAVTQTTQRPGQEAGNAISTVVSRINRPRTQKDLKEQFGFDVTTAEGDAKKMVTILDELAAIYPTLNTLEQGRLRNLIAGARQGNRFAIIMESWNEALFAQAKAGLDANSAMRENNEILDSVSAKIQSLETQWVRAWHGIGEAGLFDAVIGYLKEINGLLELTGDGLDQINRFGRKAGIPELSSNIGKGITGGLKDSALKSIPGIGPVLSQASNLAKFIPGRSTPDLPDNEAVSARLSKLATESVQSKNRVESLAAGSRGFQQLARNFENNTIDLDKALKLFDDNADLLSQLKGGESNVAKARLQVRPLLESLDRKGGADALRGIAGRLQEEADSEAATREQKRAAAIQETEAAIARTTAAIDHMNEQLADSTGEKRQAAWRERIEETNTALKDQQESLATLQQQIERKLDDPLDAHRENLDGYLADLKLIGDTYSKLLTSFGSTGFANLDAKLKTGAARLEGDVLQDTIAAARYDNSLSDTLGIYPEKKAGRDAIVQAMEVRLEEIRKASDEAERSIELDRQAALLQQGFDNARRSTASGFSRYEIGRSEGERLSARTAGILGELRGDLQDPSLGTGGPASDAKELGAIVERMSAAKEGLAGMEDRINRALAERVNLESEITDQTRKQTEEASRRLALASREDQLRAAAAAAVQRARGGRQFSLEEFQNFSGETRQAISNFLPNSVRRLDTTERDQNESRAKLDTEIAGLAVTLRAMRRNFEELLPTAEEKAAGLVDVRGPLSGKQPTAEDLINARDKDALRVNLTTGPIHVNLDIANHIRSLTSTVQGYMDQRLRTELSKLRELVTRDLDPDTSAAAGTW